MRDPDPPSRPCLIFIAKLDSRLQGVNFGLWTGHHTLRASLHELHTESGLATTVADQNVRNP